MAAKGATVVAKGANLVIHRVITGSVVTLLHQVHHMVVVVVVARVVVVATSEMEADQTLVGLVVTWEEARIRGVAMAGKCKVEEVAVAGVIIVEVLHGVIKGALEVA